MILIDCDWLISIHTNHSSNMKRNRDRQCDAQSDTRATHFNRTSISLMPDTHNVHTCACFNQRLHVSPHQFAPHRDGVCTTGTLTPWNMLSVNSAPAKGQLVYDVRVPVHPVYWIATVNWAPVCVDHIEDGLRFVAQKLFRFGCIWIVAFLPEFISCLFA